MYVPSYALIARAIGISERPEAAPPGEHVTIDIETLRLLLRFIALAADYDEATYLKENPDVAQAHEEGKIADLHVHFIESGFFEGRKASYIHFDEQWYLKTYPDVADAVAEGVVPSAFAHFKSRGEVEMRSPNLPSLRWIQAWAEALSRPRLNGA